MSFLWQFLIFSCFFIIHLVSAQCCLNHVVFGGTNRFIDLSFPFDERTIYFHVEGNFTLTTVRENKKWPAFRVINAPEHGGTYVDAPYFFEEHGSKITGIPTDKYITQLIVVDISSKVNGDPKYVLNMKDVESGIDKETMEHISKYNSLIVFKFGWSKYYYSDPEKYLGFNKEKETYFTPAVGKDVAEWVAANDNGRKLVGIGVDLAAADVSTSEKSFQVHKILAKAGQYLVEGLNLEHLNVTGHNCTALVMPMKITEAAGSPANVVAICPTVSSCNDQDQSGKEEVSKEGGNEDGHQGCKHGCQHKGSNHHSCHHHGGHQGHGGHGHGGHKDHGSQQEHGGHAKHEEYENHEHEKHEEHEMLKHHDKEHPNKHETHEHETDKKQPDTNIKPEESATTQKPTSQGQSQGNKEQNSGKPQNIIEKISQFKDKFTGKY